MRYEIECYIETIDSEGCFTFHGSEGFCLDVGGLQAGYQTQMR